MKKALSKTTKTLGTTGMIFLGCFLFYFIAKSFKN